MEYNFSEKIKELQRLETVFNTFSPAKEKDIDTCNKELINRGYPFVPQDYMEFLLSTDGFYWNGCFLYGANYHQINHNLAVPSLLDFNPKSSEFEQHEMTFIGDKDEGGSIYYCPGSRLYKIFDNEGEIITSYKDLYLLFEVEFINFMVKHKNINNLRNKGIIG